MADDSRVVIGVEADTKQADKEFDKLKKKMEQATSNIQGAMGGSSASSNAQGAMGGGSQNGTNLQTPSTFDDPNNWGKTAGKLFTAEFIARMSKQGVSLIAQAMRSPVTGNDTADMFESVAGGGIEGAVAGAVAGGALGAKGGVYGAIAGLIGGGLIGFLNSSTEIQNRKIQESVALRQSELGYQQSKAFGEAGIAENFIDKNLGREEKLNFYSEQIRNLNHGKNGIFNLYERMRQLSEEGEGESVAYKRIQDLYNKKMSARLNFELKEFALKTEIPFKKYEASELTDSFAKQGIEIGNQVNVEDLQQQQINVLQRIRDMLQDIVTSTNKRGVDSYMNEAYAYRFNLNT